MYFMKFFSFSLFLICIFGAICPNKCNSNGKCSKSGKCICNEGFEGDDCRYKTCKSGSLFPGGQLLVCSGNGDCNKETGICNCYEGYTGDECANVGCVNGCSGHGVCVSSNSATFVQDINYPYYKLSKNTQDTTPNMFVCVCDNEYTGYDCSEKKCPLGYMAIGSCDVPQDLQMELKIPAKTVTGTTYITYIEYTDQFDNKWYSKKITLAKDSKISKYGDDVMPNTQLNNSKTYPDYKIIDWSEIAKASTPSLEQFKWCYVFVDFLYTLPPGTIDLKNTTLNYNNNSKIISGCGEKSDGIFIKEHTTTPPDTNFTITLNFGKLQTGNKSGIKLITKNDEIDSGIVDQTNLITYESIVATSNAVSPLICSGFGNCDKNTGKCKCYNGFTGYVCNKQEQI